MLRRLTTTAIALGVLASVSAAASQPAAASPAAELDRAIYSVLTATVAADDIAGMGRLYFPDAVLVSPKSTTPIKETLERWGRDMVAAKTKGHRASVEFRFTARLDNATTAFHSGLFNYTVTETSGASRSQYYPFEMLLAKVNGQWRILMERQFAEVSQGEWDKLPK